MLNIYINTWGNYNNNGADFGEWITLPMDEDELEEKLDEVAEAMGDNDPEWFVNDYEWTIGVTPFEVNEMDNYFKLNERLEELDTLDIGEQEALMAVLDAITGDFEEALDIVSRGRYSFYPGYDLDELAHESVDECYNLPDIALRYFDYEAFARDLGFDGYHETEWGVIVSC